MIYIIFSDVHSNWESLQAFEKITKKIKHDKKVCLGDIVGYGADPNICVDWIRENVDIVLAGNHDFAAVEKTDTSYFNPFAFKSCVWTRKELSSKSKKYLDSLSAHMQEDEISWVHSSPFEPHEWHYVTSGYHGVQNFPHFKTRLCFLGHSHIPLILESAKNGEVEMYPPQKRKLKSDCRYIINVGSLGQPRDGNPAPVFVIFDSDSDTVEFRRYPYDVAQAQKKILQNDGLPPFLAERLEDGR